MRQAKWFIHPVFVFVLSTAALGISLFLYIYWYVAVSHNLKQVISRYHLEANQFFEAETWVVILILSLLVGVIMLGILIIFIYNFKTLQLYRLQRNFINNFTHELKTPVTSLKIYLETFERYALPREEQLKYIRFMLQDVERLSGNINSLLNLARIESRLYEGESARVDLADTVRQFVARNRHLFRECDICVTPPPQEPVFHPLIVPLFDMLLMNVLNNALKYNVADTPRVDISFHRDRHGVRVRFRDNGIGLPKGEQNKIFRKFYQGRHDERVPVGGSGIGLYLVQQIARLHRGKVFAESAGPELGAVITLWLPPAPAETTRGRNRISPTQEETK